MEAIAQAAFVDDLERMSHGMDTWSVRKGLVSGGQKQRISLARALLRDAELLLLDDSLSAVDAKTEQAIIDTIQKNEKTRRPSLFPIACRLFIRRIGSSSWIKGRL